MSANLVVLVLILTWPNGFKSFAFSNFLGLAGGVDLLYADQRKFWDMGVWRGQISAQRIQ